MAFGGAFRRPQSLSNTSREFGSSQSGTEIPEVVALHSSSISLYKELSITVPQVLSSSLANLKV